MASIRVQSWFSFDQERLACLFVPFNGSDSLKLYYRCVQLKNLYLIDYAYVMFRIVKGQ